MRERELGPPREQALRRQALAGVTGDPTKTSCPVDLLELHRIVSHDTVRAASWFGYTARAVLGPPARKNILDQEPRPGEISENKLGRLTTEYIAAIQGLGRAERDVLLDLLHFQQTPFWLLSSIAGRPLRPAEKALRAFTMAALAKLTRQWDAYHRASRPPVRLVAVAAE